MDENEFLYALPITVFFLIVLFSGIYLKQPPLLLLSFCSANHNSLTPNRITSPFLDMAMFLVCDQIITGLFLAMVSKRNPSWYLWKRTLLSFTLQQEDSYLWRSQRILD